MKLSNPNLLVPAVLLLALPATAPGLLAAEATLGERNAWPADTRGTIPRMAKPPTIDGIVTADEWAGAAEFNAQVSQVRLPDNTCPFFPRPVAWYVGWDDQHIYLASRTPLLENERPKRVARQPVGSTVMMDDSVELWLDPKGRNAGEKLASYFQGIINSLGVTYFSRLFPSIGARTGDWNPHWKIATHLDDQYMDVEVAMDNSGFDLRQPNQPGDVWGMMFARNFMFRNWNQSAMAWSFPGFGFSVNSEYPLMTLADASPFVRFRNPREIMNGRAFVEAGLVNPSAAPVKLKVQVNISGPDPKPLFEKTEVVSVPANGSAPFQLDEPIQPPIDLTKSARYRYSVTVTTEDGSREVFHTHFGFDPKAGRDWMDMKFPPPPELTAAVGFNPVRFLAEAKVDVIDSPRRDDAVAARVIVTDAQGKTLAESRTTNKYMHMFFGLVQLPELAPGKYPWTAFAQLQDGSELKAGEGEFEKKDEARAFPWWNTELGDAEKVLQPFTAVKAEKGGRVLKAWGKEYHLDGLALPQRILVTGNADHWPAGRSGTPEVLAGPVRLEAVVAGQPVAIRAAGRPKLVKAVDHRITLGGSSSAGGLKITTATRLEQDGAYFVELTLAPERTDRAVTVDSLDLVIPVRSEVATFLNAYGVTGHGGGYVIERVAARNDAGKFKVWDPTQNGQPVMTVGNFISQVWLGNEFRGLLWYADNDRGWTPADDRIGQEVVRDGDAVAMAHHLISTPTAIDAPRTIRFVLQPTPIRPLQPGWRMLNTNFSQSFLPWDAMGRNSAAYSAMINLPNDAAYAKSLEFTSKWPAFKAPEPNLAMYMAPHTESSAIMTSDWPARNYFGSEWEDGTYTKTLNDHTLWWVHKWIEQGGLQGLYHDQFAPHLISSVSSGLAYLLPDGRVQRGYALTTRRDYVMRQHALWLEKGINPPRTLTHVTNGGPMGSYGWIESALDGEDKQINKNTPTDFADTWPSERIRAGSIAYNLGTTYAWMRLIDTKGMTPEEIAHHQRVYAGHCLVHDVSNAWMVSNAWNWGEDSALINWGLNDDRVFFWPFWSNGDVITVSDPDVKVSAWTLPDRVLLCAFNYRKDQPADCTIKMGLKKIGVALPANAQARNLENEDAAVGWDAARGQCQIKVGPRDYVLIGIGAE